MNPRYSREEKESLVARYKWYHRIDLGDGVVTPGNPWEHLWDFIRETRAQYDYTGRRVLDIGSWDGLWAFEAERLGASFVVATDTIPTDPGHTGEHEWENVLEKFLLCRELLGSRVIPYYNVPPHALASRLDPVIFDKEDPEPRMFDIVQHMGVLYHLRNPMLSLSAARNVLRTGGRLLMETAVMLEEERPVMLFSGDDPARYHFYGARSNWWCPSIPCLKEMLRTCFLEPLPDTLRILPQQDGIGRAALWAEASPLTEADPELRQEMKNHFRNPDHIPFYPPSR